MYTDLFFVPSSRGDRKQKELIDSSCRAHNARLAHRKRRSTHETVELNAGAVRAVKEVSSSVTNSRGTTAPTIEKQTASLAGSHVQNELIPHAVQAVEFVRFHLVKSWSPMFMKRFYAVSKPQSEVEQDLELAATQWLWSLWNSDAALFWSVVASILPVMRRYLDHDQKANLQALALELKGKSFESLRSSLQNDGRLSMPELLTMMYQVKALFREACASADLGAASYHAEALARLALRLHECHSNISWRRIALWGDALPALLQLRRPAVDFSITLGPIVREIWSAAESLIRTDLPAHFEPPESVLTELLRDALRHLKKAVHIIENPRSALRGSRDINNELLFQWLISKAEHHMCRLINLYCDLIEQEETAKFENGLSTGERHMQASVALTLLYLYQKTFFDIYQDDGTDINESALLVQPALKKSFQSAKNFCSRSEWLFFRGTIFWILFVGARAEKRLSSACRYSDFITARDDYFTSELCKYSSDLKICFWAEAREVLDNFCWVNFSDAGAERWYIEAVHSR